MATSASNAASASRLCNMLLATLSLLLLLQAVDIETKRTGFRLYKSVARSDVDYDSNVGSGRGLFRNFLPWRNTWPQKTYKKKFLPTTTTTTTTQLLNNTLINAGIFRQRELQLHPDEADAQYAPRQRVTRRHRRGPGLGTRSLEQQSSQRRRNTRPRQSFRTQQAQQAQEPYSTSF